MTALTMRVKSTQGLDMNLSRSSGTSDYEALINKPKIEGVALMGDKTFKQLGLRAMELYEIDNIIFGRS